MLKLKHILTYTNLVDYYHLPYKNFIKGSSYKIWLNLKGSGGTPYRKVVRRNYVITSMKIEFKGKII